MDFKLDADGDLEIDGGDLALVTDSAAVAQHARVRLRTIKGEWFEDTRIGIDYFGTVFQRPFNQPLVDGLLKRALLTTPGVEELLAFSSSLDPVTRELTVTAQVRAGTDVIDFTTALEVEI